MRFMVVGVGSEVPAPDEKIEAAFGLGFLGYVGLMRNRLA
jgi:hypothetical protein